MKEDRRGIGFDPYKNAEDVRAAAALARRRTTGGKDRHGDDALSTADGVRTRLSMANVLTGREDALSMQGFGLGAGDHDDAYDIDADVYGAPSLDQYDIVSTLDEQVALDDRARRLAATARSSSSSTGATDHMLATLEAGDDAARRCSDGRLPLRGFRLPRRAALRPTWFALPRVPRHFNERHVFGPHDDRPSDLPTYRGARAVRRRALADEPDAGAQLLAAAQRAYQLEFIMMCCF